MGPEVTDKTVVNKPTNDAGAVLEKNQLLQNIQQALANTPVIDMNKVEEIKNKIAQKQLDILGNETQRLASAERIAKHLIDEVSFVAPDKHK